MLGRLTPQLEDIKPLRARKITHFVRLGYKLPINGCTNEANPVHKCNPGLE